MLTAVWASAPVLGSPVKTDDQFQFTLTGDANAGYLIQTSTNLSTPSWAPLCISADSNTTRIITFTNLPNAQSFYRAVGFSAAIFASGAVDLGGGTVVDGYNSALGGYDISTNRNATGNIATDSRQPSAINVGTAHVFGMVVTGPGGTVTIIDGGGAVGDVAWNASQTGIQPGFAYDNMNISFASNSPPAGTPVSPPVVSESGSNITVLADGLYSLPSFTSNSRYRPMIVTGNATLWVTGNFVISGATTNAGYVSIEPGASLRLYVGGMAAISGGGVVNMTGRPANFSYLGLPTNTSLNYSGIAKFVGTINAPQADINLVGNLYGAIICNSFACSGSSVHYDTNH